MVVKNWNEVSPIVLQIYNYFLLLLKTWRCYSEFKPSIYYLFFSFSWRDLSSFRNVCCILVFLLKLISLISYSSPTFYLFFFHFGTFFNSEIEKDNFFWIEFFCWLLLAYYSINVSVISIRIQMKLTSFYLSLLQFLLSFLSHLLTRL